MRGDILGKISGGAWPSNKGLCSGLLDCTFFCALHIFLCNSKQKMAPIRKREEREGSQAQDRRQRENTQLCCLTLAGEVQGMMNFLELSVSRIRRR